MKRGLLHLTRFQLARSRVETTLSPAGAVERAPAEGKFMGSAWAVPLAMLVALVGALALRVPKLDTRPLHNDEAVNAVKVSELWEQGRYAYDPDEYHGPSLHYASLPFLWLSGARTTEDIDDATLRLAPVVFGVGLVLLTLLFADGLGRAATVWAAVFTAVSPAMVFYSRYFIHEMFLVFFSALTLGAGWRYVQSRSAGWAVVAGLGVGLMWITKETFVLALAAMGIAAVAMFSRVAMGRIVATDQHPEGPSSPAPEEGSMVERLLDYWKRMNWWHVGGAMAAALAVWLVFFSSFFTHAAGLADSVRTYLPWLNRAGGHSPHIHPWSFYFERLGWFHPGKGPIFTEGLILLLAVIGAGSSLRGSGRPLGRFLAIYTLALTGIYCVIPYKTPWCLLGFLHGLILLAGLGAAALIEWTPPRALRAVILTILLAATAQLSWQAWQAGVVHAADRRNPYVYAQTAPDLQNLVKRAEGLARVAPEGHDTIIKTIVPDGDYWPLPWSLRRFKHAGWYETLPDDPFAPIVIVSTSLNARLDDKSDRRWIMAGITELRPGKFLELYVEFELWKRYVATLPRVVDPD